ncbi:MAG: preprotein translocase subunit YajC [Devosiaceae bacterium]|nr:preprotein translocase subunit YajC [Devosiaceae bacterium MH13]
MLVTPAYAQAAGAAGGGSLVMSILPFILIFVIMWFLIIRPQRQQMKRHREMIANVRRNDTIVTSGGLIGKVTKVLDDESNEIEVQLAEGVKVRLVRSMIQDVRTKAEPVAANDKG